MDYLKMNPDITSKLTSDQVKSLQEFKCRVTKEHGAEIAEDEYQLRRFLKAREFDVNKAEVMFRNSLAWRKKNSIDKIEEEYNEPEVLTKYIPLNKLGFDKDGQVVIFMDYGNMDLRGMLSSAKKQEFIKSIFLSVEKDVHALNEKSKKEGRVIERWSYIFDYEHFSFAQATYKEGVEILMHLLDIYEANYPERLHAAYIINASVYFTVLFSFIKPVLSGATLQKLYVYGKDGWKDSLLQFVSPDTLPVYLGGNRVDTNGDPKCSLEVNYGGLVPKSYYLPKVDRCIANEPGVKKYSISRMSRFFIEIHVEIPGSQIEWEFETENYDIGYGINYLPNDCKTTEYKNIIPVQKVDTRFFSETGVYTCTEAGKYSLVFDNSFSWFRQKELFCRIHLKIPNGQRTCVTETEFSTAL